jgi:hypothetical protein
MRAEGEILCKTEARKLSFRNGSELRIPAAVEKKKVLPAEPAAPLEVMR